MRGATTSPLPWQRLVSMLSDCADARASAIGLATWQMARCRRNPKGAGGFGPQALSFVGHDVKPAPAASVPNLGAAPLFAPETRRPLRAALQSSTMMRWTPPDDSVGIDVPESTDKSKQEESR